jgi:hypothetical protein
MAFAFPAYHTERLTPDFATERIQYLAHRAIAALGWPMMSSTRTQLRAKTALYFAFLGEVVTVDFEPDGGLRVESRSGMRTRCLDWGKNRRNVEAFVAVLKDMAGQEEAKRSADQLVVS